MGETVVECSTDVGLGHRYIYDIYIYQLSHTHVVISLDAQVIKKMYLNNSSDQICLLYCFSHFFLL